jgi:elongation factor 1-beta
MGITLIKIKLLPSSLETDLEEIKSVAKTIIEENKGRKVVFEEEPIAFGLKAIIAGFEQDEDEGELDPIENALNDIESISSVQVVDMRRAFG